MATRVVTLRYMTGFHCIGPECEDTCCGGWNIAVDQEHHERLRKKLSLYGEKERFKASMLRPPTARTSTKFAILAQQDSGRCTYLDPAGTCEIHRRFGEDLLNDTCALYPRHVSKAGARVELTAVLSCPEAARRALLTDDATDVVPCEPALTGRGVAAQSIEAGVTSPYAAALDLIRGAMFGLLTRREHPMASRLFFIAELADRIGTFLELDTRTGDHARLAAEIQRIETPAVLEACAHRLREAEVQGAIATSVMSKLLAARLQGPTSPRFVAVVTAVIKACVADHGGMELVGDNVDEATVSPDALSAYLDGRRAAREALFGDRLDLYLENYCKNWVMKDWFVFAPSLAVHVRRQLVKVAVIRFLLLTHPGLEAASAEGVDALDRLAVEVIYSFARTFEHIEELVSKTVDATLDRVPPLVSAVALLRV